MKYSYFVSYFFLRKDKTTGLGNVTHSRGNAITKFEDITDVTNLLLKHNPDWENVAILNFILLEKTRQNPAARKIKQAP